MVTYKRGTTEMSTETQAVDGSSIKTAAGITLTIPRHQVRPRTRNRRLLPEVRTEKEDHPIRAAATEHPVRWLVPGGRVQTRPRMRTATRPRRDSTESLKTDSVGRNPVNASNKASATGDVYDGRPEAGSDIRIESLYACPAGCDVSPQGISLAHSKAVDIDDRLGEGLWGFLRQIVPNAALDDPMFIFAGEFTSIDAPVRMRCAVVVTFQGDGGHGDHWPSG